MPNEEQQFREYFAARRDWVRRTAYLLCGDWHWADDLTQTAFVRLAAGWSRVRDRGALDAFVRTCLVRAYLADLRRVWRRRERSFADLPNQRGVADGADTIADRMVFTAALRQLPPRQRAAVVLRYYQGLDVAATAEALGCSEGTVKSQTAKAMAALRVRLTGTALDPRSAPLVATRETS